MDKEIAVCEECLKVFNNDELMADEHCGHKCKAKNYKKEHRCESYLHLYREVKNHDRH